MNKKLLGQNQYYNINPMYGQGLNALIFGATGAIGAELVLHLLKSKQWAKVHCVVRKELEEWQTVQGREKLAIDRFDDLDEYFRRPNDQYGHISAVFFCLGSEVGKGEDLFIKIDKTYALMAADIAAKNNIQNYQYLSSNGGNPNSCLLYLRVKGEAQRDLQAKNVKVVTILKPGLLVGRRNARTGEKIVACLCPCACIPQIPAVDCANVMRLVAERNARLASQQKRVEVLQNGDMVEIVEQNRG